MTNQTPIAALVAAIENVAPCRITPKEFESWDKLCSAACDALPSLRQVAQIEAENAQLRADLEREIRMKDNIIETLQTETIPKKLAAAQAQVAAQSEEAPR